MSDFAHEYTDKEIEALEKRITKAYRRVYNELSEKVTSYFEQFEKRDTAQRTLLNEGKITELEYQQWRLAQIGRGKHFEAMRDDAAERLTKANQIAASYIKDEMPDIFAVNLNHMAYGLEKEYGNIGFTIYDENMAKKLIADEADFLPAPSINVPKDLWWNKKLITAEMTSGILQGESIKKLADRFQNVTDANRVSAIRNARTFCTAAENAGRQEGFNQAAKMGVKVRKQWLATLDNRTRHSHQLLDGQIVDYDKPFKSVLGSKMMFPADKSGAKAGDLYNCRCTMITVEKSGIVAEEVSRLTEDGKNISELNYEEWQRWKKSVASKEIEEYNKKGLSNVNIDFKQTRYALAKEKTQNAIETAYEYHRKRNNLQSVPFAELKQYAFEEFVDFKNLSDEICEVFATGLENLVKKYDTAIYRIRTMAKDEAMLLHGDFAYVIHNYENDTAEMVINPAKFKNIKESIKNLVNKNYCADIYEENFEKYVVTHEFAHSIIQTTTPLKNSRNWVNADYAKIKKVRKEIEQVYEDYKTELGKLEERKKDAEMRFIMGELQAGEEARETIKIIKSKKISTYSLTNADEFMAESFTFCELGSGENEYAQKIMEIIKRYFGR